MLSVQVKKTLGVLCVDLAFEADKAQVIALFGPSGAGKTSVISMIAGIMKPDVGRIALNGTIFFDSAAGFDLAPGKRRIGYVFQDGKLFPHLNVRSNLEYGMKLVSKPDRKIGFDEVVTLLGIEDLLSRRPGRLSGGEKQRVAIGRALLTSPRLLLMDEPLASLDANRKDEVLPFIKRLKDSYKIPIIYVSHLPEEVAFLADIILVIDKGRLDTQGGTDLIKS